MTILKKSELHMGNVYDWRKLPPHTLVQFTGTKRLAIIGKYSDVSILIDFNGSTWDRAFKRSVIYLGDAESIFSGDISKIIEEK